MERIEISGFTLDELGASAANTLWRRGGLPPAYLADSESDSYAWRHQFIQTLPDGRRPRAFGNATRLVRNAEFSMCRPLGRETGRVTPGEFDISTNIVITI